MIDAFAPARLGPVTLRNRTIKAATFEGAAPGGLVSQQLIDYHLAVAEGGVGMTTVAYLAVSPEGRTHADQIHWRSEALPGLQRLTDAIHATGASIAAQIGHAGPVANAASNGVPAIGAGRRFNPLSMRFDKAATRDDLDRIVADHADAARMAADVGFDAVEVHLGHNYLASAFLSPKLNHRKDDFGGSMGKRAVFPRQILAAVREAVGDRIAVTAKLNMRDGFRGGLEVEESVAFGHLVEADGHLDAIELTGGSSLMNPMYLFRGDAPVEEMATRMPLPRATRAGMRVGGKAFFKQYPWEPLYFLEQAQAFRRELSLPLILLGGITDRAAVETAMAEGFAFVAMGRALLREPDLVNRMQTEPDHRSTCTHCNLCMSTIYMGTHCHLADANTGGVA
jgi:2,4-dienoyl-CoA reductase-like NADH-dependent reductase (Old Yellow Enzyme family)